MTDLLYRKCHNFSFLHNTTNLAGQTKDVTIYFKKVQFERPLYGDFLKKLTELYKIMTDKVDFFEEMVHKIFEEQIGANFLSVKEVFKGFFFIFVYQDLIVRELVLDCRIQMKAEREFNVLCYLEKEYNEFMEHHLLDWTNLLFNMQIFQSYSSIVVPNEQYPLININRRQTQGSGGRN